MFNKPSKILVAYDGSNLSKKALDYAKLIASNDEKTEIVVISVMKTNSFMGAYEAYTYMEMRKIAEQEVNQNLEEAKEQLKNIPNKSIAYMVEGDPANKIVEIAEEEGIELIVMGSRGLGKVREWFLGSVSHNVVQLAKCPVFIIK